MRELTHQVDFCVVGGGMAGLCAAVAAARRGAKVALIQDRPMLGGNASSEIRMHVCGAHGPSNKETGIVEEIMLENFHRNALGNWHIWDTVLYETARFEPNITLLLNCSVNDAEMDRGLIRSVRAWQLTSETWHTVEATLFADCSGDSILAPLSGAEFRIGREASSEFNEDIEPPEADRKTMGMSILIQGRETTEPQPFVAPDWAHAYLTDDELPNRGHDHATTNFWWIELGGENDSIHDTEELRDELMKVAFGVWDHIKNHGEHGADNWALEWIGILPGKRESRRYIGDHILTQNDVRAEGRFDDLVAYGGWSMDDHHPAGFRHPGAPTIFHPAPSPFGIPYRSLYSKNVDNLLFAGRNISATHAAMSSTRVMATCATLGQAAGTAAAIAVRDGLTPRDVYEQRAPELKQALMDDDCYLPWNARAIPQVSATAKLTASEGDPEPLRNGFDRPIGDVDNGWTCPVGGWVEYSFDEPTELTRARIVFDSDLNRHRLNLPSSYPLDQPARGVPATMVKAFRLEAKTDDGEWQAVAEASGSRQRLVKVPLAITTSAIRLIPEATWGADDAHIFAFDVA